MKRLSRKVAREHKRWLRNVPKDYDMHEIKDSSPIIVTLRYGQNAPIGDPDALDRDAHNWLQERDYAAMRFISVAFATDIGSVCVL